MKKRQVSRIYKSCLMECLSFIFNRHNRQLMEFGTKRIRMKDGDSLLFPKIRRTRSCKAVVKAYQELKKENGTTVESVGKRFLMYIIGMFTSGQQGIKECVDYCLGVLVFDNFRKLKKIVIYIVREQVDDVDERKKLTGQLTTVNDYLKHGFCHHINKDADGAHDSRCALIGRRSTPPGQCTA